MPLFEYELWLGRLGQALDVDALAIAALDQTVVFVRWLDREHCLPIGEYLTVLAQLPIDGATEASSSTESSESTTAGNEVNN